MGKKVLMIIPRLAGGGAERVVSNLTMQLKGKYQMDILVDYDEIEYPYAGKVVKMNPGRKTASGKWNELSTYIRKVFLLRKMKKKCLYDCYISHSKISHIVNIMTGKKNCRVILTLHNKSENMKASRIRRFVEYFARNYYRKADLLVAVSEGVRQEYIKDFRIPPERIVSIWNGSDVGLIRRRKEETLSEQQKAWLRQGRTVTTMGRLCEQKGQCHLIRAFSRVVRRLPDARLLLLGEGPLKEKLMQDVKRLGLGKNVIFCGFQRNPFALLAKSDLFVFSSLWEGFGYALEEAICCDVPCISTDFQYGAREILHYHDNAGYEEDGSVREAVYTDYGVLVPVCRPHDRDGQNMDKLISEEKILADAIVKVLEDEEYRGRIVKANRSRLKEFSLEEMGEKWSRVIG